MGPILVSWLIAAAVIAFLITAALRNRRDGYIKPRRAISPIVEAAAWLWSLAEDPPGRQEPEAAPDPPADLASLNHAVTAPRTQPVREEHAVH